MNLFWVSRDLPVCQNCEKQQQSFEETSNSKLTGIALKTIYFGALVLAFWKAAEPIIFIPVIVIAFAMLFVEKKRTLSFVCSSCQSTVTTQNTIDPNQGEGK